tara:strand:- start:161 stop:484 length:324 start_codon:yes stop_codon:yes gene_type:complete
MKKSQLKQIIKEEIKKALSENFMGGREKKQNTNFMGGVARWLDYKIGELDNNGLQMFDDDSVIQQYLDENRIAVHRLGAGDTFEVMINKGDKEVEDYVKQTYSEYSI